MDDRFNKSVFIEKFGNQLAQWSTCGRIVNSIDKTVFAKTSDLVESLGENERAVLLSDGMQK